jgi:hypothetical protein
MIRVERSVFEPGHRMLTIGYPRILALRIARGRLDRRGVYHPNQPCVFFIAGGKRRSIRR